MRKDATTMTTDNTLAVRAALESGGGAAETQLALIASTGGDLQLQLVVEKLTAAEINVLVEEFDMSKPSVAHAFISPEQFLEAFDRLGARWSQIDEIELTGDYAEIQRDVEDFLCPMILSTGDPARIKLMVTTLFKHPFGGESVLFAALEKKDYFEYMTAPQDHPITRGTWQDLLSVAREHFPSGYAEIAEQARAIYQDGEGGSLEFAGAFIYGMHQEAMKHHTAQEPETEEFVDI
jgi:hypothetical protein